MSLKVLLAPDLHAWYEGPGPADARIDEWRRCGQAMVDAVRAERVRLVLIPGDLYVTNRPSPAQVLAIIHLFREFEAAGAEVICIAGNHDVAAPGAPNFVSLLGSIRPDWGITEPRVVARDIPGSGRVAIGCLPWSKGADDDALAAITRALVAEMEAAVADHRILMGHWATDVSTFSSGEYALGREPVLRLADLQTLPVGLVALGHIHKVQMLVDTLAGGPVVLHTGALTRRDFGEADDERAFCIYDLESRVVRWLPLPARRFVTVDANGTDPAAAHLGDAYVRITYEATKEDAARFDHGRLIEGAQAAGAFYVAGVHPEIIRAERGRAEGVSESTDPLQGLDAWLGLRTDLSDELRGRVREAAQALIGEVV